MSDDPRALAEQRIAALEAEYTPRYMHVLVEKPEYIIARALLDASRERDAYLAAGRAMNDAMLHLMHAPGAGSWELACQAGRQWWLARRPYSPGWRDYDARRETERAT